MLRLVILFIGILFLNFSFSQEEILVSQGDSLIITSNKISTDDFTQMDQFVFGEEVKKYSVQPYGAIVFNDADRDVFDTSDEIWIKLNEDSIKVNSIGSIFFKNPGPDRLMKITITPYKGGEKRQYKKGQVVTKISYLKKEPKEALITNDKIVLGILLVILALIFYTSGLEGKNWKRLYTVIPALFLCYMIPAVLTSFNIIDPEATNLYHMASRYLLPGSLILLILSVDIKSLFGLGSKSLIMFFTGTIGIIIGGVFSIWIFGFLSPETVGGEGNEAAWRGMATIAGSWIGGGANQSAMLEIYEYKETLFGGMLLVDIVVANIWMAVILFGIGKTKRIDKWLKADSSAIDELVIKVEKFQKSVQRKATLTDYMVIGGLVFGGVALSHFLGGILAPFFADILNDKDSTFASSFFWMVVLSTIYGLILSFTRAKNYEGVGASKLGSVFLYILVATIGMKVDVSKVLDNPMLILVGLVWMAFHAGLLILVAKLIRAPFFFLAVGSQANVGGAASAPIVANAFHPALTTVGVLMAVAGYFIGTFGAIFCAELMKYVAT
jgi:uncharacterized membrane protein